MAMAGPRGCSSRYPVPFHARPPPRLRAPAQRLDQRLLDPVQCHRAAPVPGVLPPMLRLLRACVLAVAA